MRRRKLTKEQEDKQLEDILLLLKDGYRHEAIGLKVGISPSSVSRRLSGAGSSYSQAVAALKTRTVEDYLRELCPPAQAELPIGESQLDRIERKLDQLLSHWGPA